MKKRLLSLLLSIALMVCLFAGLSSPASAADGPSGSFLVSYTVKAGDMLYTICDAYKIEPTNANIELICKLSGIVNANWINPGQKLWLPTKAADTSAPYYNLHKYTVKAGDTMAAICNAYGGVDYDRDYKLIVALNTGIGNFNTLIAGQVLMLPVFVNPDGTVVTPTPTPEPGKEPPPGGGGGGAVPAGDTISYYLIQHVVQPGDTVYALCEKYGLVFHEYYDTIVKLNKKVNFNWMLPGTTILFPSKTLPATGPYYAVYSHKTVAGDTVYALCAAYGLNYFTYADLIGALNNRKDLTTFYVGETMYLPKHFPRTGTGAPGGTPTPPGITPTPTPPGMTPTPPPTIPEGDVLNSLVIIHAMKQGETATSVIADLKLDNTWELQQKIMQYSGLQNLNWLMVGQILYIPTTTYPEAGVPYYKIMAHKLVAGDTVYGLCEAYGLKYLEVADFIKRLNNRKDLSTYFVGETILMPILVKNAP